MSNGLIFEGGGMRGIFAAGVIDYLLDNDIRFDSVYGVSAGACHACSYVSGQRGRAYATSTDYVDNPEYCSLKSLRKTGNMFGANFLYHKIPEELYPIDNEAFKERGMEFHVAVTNCITGKAEYPQIKDFFDDMEYIRASSSLPVLSQMVPIDGYVYLDGGIVDSIPVKESERAGNDKNVVILTRPCGFRKHQTPAMPVIRAKYRRYPNMVEAMAERFHVYNDTLDYIADGVAKGSIFVIAPMGPLDIGRTETNKDKLKKAYEEGYYVTEGLSQKLKNFME